LGELTRVRRRGAHPRRHPEPEPRAVGVIGTIVAATLEFDVLRDLGGLPMLGVGLIEETSKLLVPLALLIPLRQHRTRADGLLIALPRFARSTLREAL
jgi:hypothetical protein